MPVAPVAGSEPFTRPPGLLPPARVMLPPLLRNVPLPRTIAPVTGAITRSSLPLVASMPALPVKTTLFGALIVQLLSPPVVLVTPRPVKTRLLAVESCH